MITLNCCRSEMDQADSVSKLSSRQVASLLALGVSQRSPLNIDADELYGLLENCGTAAREIILSDLQQQVMGSASGPLAFERLVDGRDEVSRDLMGHTFLDVLTTPRATREGLECLLAYSELLQQELFPISTRRTGAVIYVCARAALG